MSETTQTEISRTSALTNRDLIGWVWREYLKQHWPKILLALLLMAIEGSMLGALTYTLQPMFDTVFIAGDRQAVYWVAAAIAGIFIVRSMTEFGHRIIMAGVGLNVIALMQRRMVGHLLTLDSAFYFTNPPGSIVERVRGDTTAANHIWTQVLGSAWRDLVTIIALFAVAISVDWVWTLVAVIGVPILVIPVLVMQRYVRKKALAAREEAANLTTRLDEIFHGVNTIKLNGTEALENNRFGGTIRRYLGQELKTRIGQSGIGSVSDIVAAIGFAGVVIYGGFEIIDGEKTVGQFMSFFTSMALVFEPMRRLLQVSASWQAARASLERIRGIFDAAPTIYSPAEPKSLPEPADKADIRFDSVALSYGSEPALRGVSFTVKAGETTALVGASGAGKSTLFNVLTRLVDADSGQISVGGLPITELPLSELRGLFGVVTQDAPMFDESLRANIQLAKTDATDDEMREALEAAYLTEFVERMPNGLDTPAGPRGSQLSGGQKQRVAIARALLRNAPVLLLDEATSALDAESEKHVQEALDRLSEARTTLVIAHRLSTIRRADKIVVMDQGQVVDEGRHEDLLARGGVYARLYELQFSEE